MGPIPVDISVAPVGACSCVTGRSERVSGTSPDQNSVVRLTKSGKKLTIPRILVDLGRAGTGTSDQALNKGLRPARLTSEDNDVVALGVTAQDCLLYYSRAGMSRVWAGRWYRGNGCRSS